MPQDRMTAEDRLDIFDLFARYAWAYDCGDADAYAAVFTEDGLLADQGDLHAVGHAAIREAIKTFFDMRGVHAWQHHNDHLRIEGDGRTCTVHSYWLLAEHNRDDGQHHLRAMGWYVTRCRKVDGRWLIAERTFHFETPQGLPPGLKSH